VLSLVESLHTNVFTAGARHSDMTLTSCARDKISMASDRPPPPKKIIFGCQKHCKMNHFVHCCSFSISNKITSKGCQSASQTCDIDAKNAFFWGGEGHRPSPDTPSLHPTPRCLDLNPSHSEILPTLLVIDVSRYLPKASADVFCTTLRRFQESSAFCCKTRDFYMPFILLILLLYAQ